MKIKTKKDGNFFMLQLNGTTLQGVWRRCGNGQTWYESDTFGREYTTLTEAKQHTEQLAKEGYFGKTFKEASA